MKIPHRIIDYLEHGMSSHGWMTKEKGTALVLSVLTNSPVIAVEIGVYSGRSLLAIAMALRENGSGMVFGIDPWAPGASVKGFPKTDENHRWWGDLNHESIYDMFMDDMNRLGLQNQITVLRGTSEDAFTHGDIPEPIDFLHIDGNHSEEASVYDVTHWVPKVRKGGHVWFDDMDWQTTKAAQQKLLETCNYATSVDKCGVYIKR